MLQLLYLVLHMLQCDPLAEAAGGDARCRAGVQTPCGVKWAQIPRRVGQGAGF
jgi:hypothetical protein